MFKELELLAQIQKEEVERKALAAWKHGADKHEPVWQKIFSSWNSKGNKRTKQQLNQKPVVH